MPTTHFLLVLVSSILLSLFGALAATWIIRRFTNMELAWKAAVIIGVVNGIISSVVIWSSR